MPFAAISRRSTSGLLLIASICGGCSADTSTLKSVTSTLAPAQSPVSTSTDPPVEVYARIARGALRCWFGPEGSLKKTHVFHAKVDSPTTGNAAEIAVHTRVEGSSHGVLRAFAITIAPSGSGSVIEAQNHRFPAEQAELMIADVGRWVAGKDDCSVVGTGGWNAAAPAAGSATTDPPASASTKAAAPAKSKR